MHRLPLALFLFLSQSALAVPMIVHHQGRILDSNGLPMSGDHTVTAQLFDSDLGGSPVWQEEIDATFDNGYFQITLGERSTNPLTDPHFDGNLFLSIAIDGGTPSDRSEVSSSPFAIRANVADALSGSASIDWSQIDNTPSAVEDTLDTLGCDDGELARYSTTFSQWYCDADRVLSDSDVLGIVTGAPLDLAIGSTVNGELVSTMTGGDAVAAV